MAWSSSCWSMQLVVFGLLAQLCKHHYDTFLEHSGRNFVPISNHFHGPDWRNYTLWILPTLGIDFCMCMMYCVSVHVRGPVYISVCKRAEARGGHWVSCCVTLPYSVETVPLPDAHSFASRLPTSKPQWCSCLHLHELYPCVVLSSIYVGADNLNSGPHASVGGTFSYWDISLVPLFNVLYKWNVEICALLSLTYFMLSTFIYITESISKSVFL